jgi:hypothetical protein
MFDPKQCGKNDDTLKGIKPATLLFSAQLPATTPLIISLQILCFLKWLFHFSNWKKNNWTWTHKSQLGAYCNPSSTNKIFGWNMKWLPKTAKWNTDFVSLIKAESIKLGCPVQIAGVIMVCKFNNSDGTVHTRIVSRQALIKSAVLAG